jgi:hypothetical protein
MSLIYGVSESILTFVVFHISKVCVGFMSLSELMRHMFGRCIVPELFRLNSLGMATAACYLVTLSLMYLSNVISAV